MSNHQAATAQMDLAGPRGGPAKATGIRTTDYANQLVLRTTLHMI